MALKCEEASFVHYIEEHGNRLLNNLHFQWMNEAFCDLHIVAKGRPLPVHACVMAAFSPKIAHLISGQNIQNGVGASKVYTVNVKFNYDVMESVVTAIYTGVFQPPRNILKEVQLAVQWLKITEFISAIKRHTDDQAKDIKKEVHVKSSSGEYHFEADSSSLGSSQTRHDLEVPDHQIDMIEDTHFPSSTDPDINTATWTKQPILDKYLKNSALIRILTTDMTVDNSHNGETDHSSNIMGLSEIKTEVVETNDNNNEINTNFIKQNMARNAKQSRHLKPKNVGAVPSRKKRNISTVKPKERKERPKRQKASGDNRKRIRVKLNNSGRNKMHQTSDKASSETGKLKVGLEAGENLVSSVIEEICTNDPVKGELQLIVGDVGFIKCKKCFDKFTNLEEYHSHIQDHPVLKCGQCDQTFFSKFSLSKHIRLVHIGIDHLVCRHCRFHAKSQIELRKHAGDVHNDRKPFACSYKDCKFSTARHYQLMKHMIIHKEEKEYMCDKCSMSFLREIGLICHQRACYQLQEFLCDLCGQSFNHKQSMKNHRQVIHFGEKPFKCSVCSNTFGDQRNLRRHMRVHENSFPYVCPVCKQKFRHSNTLKMHIASKHRDLPESVQQSFCKQNGPGGASYKRILKNDFTTVVKSKIRPNRGSNPKKGQSKDAREVASSAPIFDSASFTGEFLTSPEDSNFDISNSNGLDFVVDSVHPVEDFTSISKNLLK